MNISLIISVIGPDRPGLVEQISATVTRAGGNWEDSRMIQLAGQFAGMVQVVLPREKLDALREELESVGGESLRVDVIHTDAPPENTSGPPPRRILLEVVGQDRTGIVAEISRTLAEAGVNVAELATDCRSAPWSGDRMFETHAVLEIPSDDGFDPDALLERIEEIAGDLMVEIKSEER